VPTPGSRVELELFGSYLGSADFQGAGGSVTAQRAGWRATLTRESSSGSLASLLVRTEATFYDFSEADVLGNPDPLNDAYETSFGASWLADAHAEWSWFGGLELSLAGEDAVSFDDSLVGGAIGGLRFRNDDELSLALGFAGRSRLEEDPFLIPYLAFDWRVSERLRLCADGSDVGLVAKLSERVDLALGAAFEMRQYRLNGDGPLSGGVFQDDHVELTAGLEWRPNARTTVALEAGAVAWRELHVLSDAGAELADVETGTGPIASLSIRYGF
jgi:hypothetical protein